MKCGNQKCLILVTTSFVSLIIGGLSTFFVYEYLIQVDKCVENGTYGNTSAELSPELGLSRDARTNLNKSIPITNLNSTAELTTASTTSITTTTTSSAPTGSTLP